MILFIAGLVAGFFIGYIFGYLSKEEELKK